MPTKTRKAAACLIAIVAILVVSGCGEDRSNLLPADTAAQMESDLDLARSQFRQGLKEGDCFEALETAQEVRNQVEALGSDVDEVLRRNLLDGVTQLQITIQDDCPRADAGPVEAVSPEPLPDESVTTAPDPAGNTTGATGDTGATGGTQPEPAPEPSPQPEPAPDPKPPVDTGSGGVSPSGGG